MNYQNYKENVENLCNAIISLAAKDLSKALKTLKRSPEDPDALEKRDDTMEFFQSEWFNALTEMDGKYIIHLIIVEVNRDGAVSN